MLIVWSGLPCNHLGAGILMRRLFADYPPDRLWALTTYQSMRDLASYDPVPPPKRQIPVPEIQIPKRWIDKLAHVINFLLVPWTVWRGVQLIRKEKIEAIFTVPWSQFTIAAYFMHRITDLSIHMYIMDDPAGARRSNGSQPLLYRILMPRLVRACKRVWGVSDGMCEYFEKTYEVKCLPLLPLLDLENFQKKSARKNYDARGVLQVVFTGAIYTAQVDALRRLVHVVDKESRQNGDGHTAMQLTLYTSLPAQAMERMGVIGTNVRRDEVKHEDIARVLSEADVAYLPFSFDLGMRHIAETSFPSKIAEYLAAGLPILAHAPAYSTVALYCREHECGLVVDQPDEVLLRDALVRLGNDAALRESLSEKGLEIARDNHDASRIVPDFLQQLGCTGT
jgi:glycosyltransferase involved in cell wall biosynthesis